MSPCKRADIETVLQQRFVQDRDIALAIAEDDRVLEIVGAADQLTQSFALVRAAAESDQTLRDVVGVVAARATSMRTGLCRKVSVSRVISGGIVAEKNKVWRVNGTSLQIRSMSGNETHVEHAIGFVDNENFDAGQQQLAALGEIEQPAGRRDQHVGAAHDLGFLIAEGNAADQERDIEFMVDAISDETFFDLRGEFAGRLQDQRAWHSGAGAAFFQPRQHRKT